MKKQKKVPSSNKQPQRKAIASKGKTSRKVGK